MKFWLCQQSLTYLHTWTTVIVYEETTCKWPILVLPPHLPVGWGPDVEAEVHVVCEGGHDAVLPASVRTVTEEALRGNRLMWNIAIQYSRTLTYLTKSTTYHRSDLFW